MKFYRMINKKQFTTNKMTIINKENLGVLELELNINQSIRTHEQDQNHDIQLQKKIIFGAINNQKQIINKILKMNLISFSVFSEKMFLQK